MGDRILEKDRTEIRQITDVRELDETEKELALYKFKYEMALAEKTIREKGTISAQDLEEELGIN